MARLPLALLIASGLLAASIGLRGADETVAKTWAFEPLVRPVVPDGSPGSWARGAIDRFVISRLEQAGLEPAPDASRATLIRRLCFDLTGLPPEPEDIDAFERDERPDAYERLVDRLLDSPRFGERWARHWLDVARFCESHGFEYDKLRDHAWPYRDYVVDAFNGDKPYDRFVREQIAGDVLEPVTRDGIAATAFLVCGPWDEAGNMQANATQRAAAREEELEDMVSAVAQTFLGVTANCARCHDHKFDPVPQTDYYRLRSVLSGVRHGERPLESPAEARTRQSRDSEQRGRKLDLEARLAALEGAARQRVLARRRGGRSGAEAKPASSGPQPMARWTFDADARDQVGSLHGTLEGGALLRQGRLVLNGSSAYLRTESLERELRVKTLEAWVALPELDQGGGAALSIETPDGALFDAIVFGERQPRQWTAGSSFFERTRDLDAPEEAAPPGELVHVAVVYAAPNKIAFFRNGKPHGEPYALPASKGLAVFPAGGARVLIGKRHTGGGRALLAGEVEEAAIYDRALTPAEIEEIFAASPHGVADVELVQALAMEERRELDDLRARSAALRAELAAAPALPLVYAGVREEPSPTRRLERGDVLQPQEPVAPGGLARARSPNPEWGLGPEAPEAERRRQLADWIASPEQPLAARVMANRLWHHHFGQGLVSTPNDFGAAGARPSHPELLDWLASELIANGYSLKRLHRLLVCSSTYRQSPAWNEQAAKVDAEGRLWWRSIPRRLEAEALRDALLAASGQLNLALGGPSFRDFDALAFPAATYSPADRDDPACRRRSIYRMNVQSGKNPLLEAFDCPEASVKTPRRGVTTTPGQALALMNSPWALRAASRLAERARREAATLDGAIARAWRLLLGRGPQASEAEAAALVAREHGLETVCWALCNTSEVLYVD